jgi:hypothetical protein
VLLMALTVVNIEDVVMKLTTVLVQLQFRFFFSGIYR